MTDDHDPLSRALPTEPHFVLLARDHLSPGFARLYAIVRERGPDAKAKAHAILDTILISNAAKDPRPHKDKQHAWSARAKADEMAEWHRLNMLAKPQSGKVNTGTEI